MTDPLDELLTILEGADIRARFAHMIDELGGVEPADAAALLTAIDSRMLGMATSLRDVIYEGDTTDSLAMLPWIWLELRFEWMRLNQQMQYQTMLQGMAKPLIMARGAALSYLLEVIELRLDTENAYVVTKIAADPAAVARGSIERTDRLFALMAAASAGGRDAVETLLLAQHQITKLTDSVPVRREFGKAISTVIEKVGSGLRVSVDDFIVGIEGLMVRILGRARVRVIFESASPDSSLTIPSAIANGLLKAAEGWMMALRDTGMERDAAARLAAHRPPYITLTGSLRRDGDRVSLELQDNSDGTVQYRPNLREWPIRDLKLHLAQRAGWGSCIRFGCDVTSIAEYMMLRVGTGADDALIGVPISAVNRIERRDASALAMQGSCLIDRHSGGTIECMDLGTLLFGQPISTEDATYVLVNRGETDGASIALRVRAIDGVCRGSIKRLPELLSDSPLRGFVQSDLDIISVLDLNRLLSRTHHSDGQLVLSAMDEP